MGAMSELEVRLDLALSAVEILAHSKVKNIEILASKFANRRNEIHDNYAERRKIAIQCYDFLVKKGIAKKQSSPRPGMSTTQRTDWFYKLSVSEKIAKQKVREYFDSQA